MQASSRESYGAAQQRLVSLLVDADADAIRPVADELLAVAAMMARQPRLRRALSDPARSAGARADLVRSLLTDKVGAQALDLVVALVAGRWASAAELLDGAELLGVDALLAAADKAEELADVEDELFRFGQIVAGDPQLAATLGDSTIDTRRRTELARSLLVERARPVTVRLAELAVAGFGGRTFAAGLTRLVELAAARRERSVAYVTVASTLSADDQARLGATLGEMYGREVSLKIIVDPGIIGGVRVQIDNDLYDGTIARRLLQTRHALAGRR